MTRESSFYKIEILHHKLFLDISDGLKYFAERFDNAILLWLNAYANMLLQEARAFQNDMSRPQRHGLLIAEARLHLREMQLDRALDIYETLNREADEGWKQSHRSELFSGIGECYLMKNDLSQAAEWFQRALKQATQENRQKDRADILVSLGYIRRRQGRFIPATCNYESSIAIYKELRENQREYAAALNNLGNVYRLLGQLDKAIIDCSWAF